ncbi:MAG: hypothetical protein KGR48_06305 [Alphaproteobacteria bacterium]|nr:hypothetical protein [Alphaproteobacteria bacterium]MBU6473176.1 hypothetical protein [Alphaproteobacteria bacterium]MDE2012409.1 hypothetical protein [Alphaproteobacteria bacterium]MDE2073137.1 hypothetical protein [Alphaproteobacteria bacterium]MDE2353019.1 hypothetical protein [Alphaproteobacteria bacterium]
MTKIGVGVGEDFPIEDRNAAAAGAEAGAAPGDEAGAARQGDYDPGYGPCGWSRQAGESYEDWRARRDDWRRQRHEWRAQRREWRRRYREEQQRRYGPGDPFYYYWGLPRVLRIILIVAVAMLIFRLVADAPLIILGAAVLAVLYAAHRHYGPFHDRDFTPPSSGTSGTPPAQGN